MLFIFHGASEEQLAADLSAKEALVQSKILEYLTAFEAEKKLMDAITAIKDGESIEGFVQPMLNLLPREIHEVTVTEKSLETIQEELEAEKHHEHRNEYIHMEYALNFAGTKEHFLYTLLQHLHGLLSDKLHTLRLLASEPANKILRKALEHQWSLQQRMTADLHREVQSARFGQLYANLLLIAHAKQQLQEKDIECKDAMMQEFGYDNPDIKQLYAYCTESIRHRINDSFLHIDWRELIGKDLHEDNEWQAHGHAYVNSVHFEAWIKEELQ